MGKDLDLQSLDKFKSEVHRLGLARDNRFVFMLSFPDLMIEKVRNVFGSALGSIPGLGNVLDLTGMSSLQNILGDSVALAGSYLLSLRCKAASVPNISFNISETHINGRIKRVANAIDYDSLTLEFYVDEDFIVHAFFMIWANIILNQFNKQIGYFSEYVSRDSQLLVLNSEMGQSIIPGVDLGSNVAQASSVISAVSQKLGGGKQMVNVPGATSTVIFENMFPTEIGEMRVDWESENNQLILPVTFRFDYAYTKVIDVLFNHG